MSNIITLRHRKLGSIFAAAFCLLLGSITAVPAQQLFSSPDEAIKALGDAVDTRDHQALATIFGPRIRDMVSGDDVADKAAFDEFAAKIATSKKAVKVNEQKYMLNVGEDDWPFAAPIIKAGDKWRFDTDAGLEELINRRIGANELDAILACQVYAIAQFEYFDGDDHDSDQVSEFAQKIASTQGQRDGLFWKAAEGEEESPLGPLFAVASIAGYKAKEGTTQSAAPFHGYNFKVLYRQGPFAPGGRFSYMINGNMIAGFALVAYPAKWGNSGIMTFIINQQGRVYQKNLGPRTSAIASAMTEYNPDITWELADKD